MIYDLLTAFLILVGASFMLLAALGLVRFPDVFMRLQATTKASTLGAGSILFGVAVHFMIVDVTARAILVLAFIFITAPAAAHAIARAAHMANSPMWEETCTDELANDKQSEGWSVGQIQHVEDEELWA